MRNILLALFLGPLAGAVERPRPALAKPYLVAPIIIDNKVTVDAWIFPRPQRRLFAVEAQPLIESLRPYLKDEGLQNLQKRIRVEGILYLTDLESLGISPQFNEQNLEMTLEVPLRHRRANELDLNFIEVGEQKFIRPREHSGYLNIRTQQTYQYGNATSTGKLPLSGYLDFVENIQGIVFESTADYQEGSHYPWKRQDTRLRFDSEEHMIRTTLGDLTLGARGFQSSPAMAGISVVREFSIQPYKTLRPLSNTEIVIKRSSLLEIYVNGFLYSQLRLAPGIFNIRDFPLATGQNSVKVKIRDDLGQEELYDFSVLFENTLLGKGIQEFSYAIGLPWSESGADRAYDDRSGFTSAYHRLGMSDNFTLGINFQNYFSKTMMGLEVSGISSWGYLSFDGAFSDDTSSMQGLAQRVRYRSLDRMFGQDIPLIAALEFENRDEDFNPVTAIKLLNTNYVRRYDMQLSLRVGQGWVLGAGAGTLEYPTKINQTTYRSNLIVPFGSRTRMELSINRDVGLREEERGLISFFWSESQGKYSASAYYDTLQKSLAANFNRNNLYRYDDMRWNIAVREREGQNTGSFSGEYLAQPLSLHLDHFTTVQNSKETHSTSLGVNTALVWVGNRFAFSQPIADSFVLVSSQNLPKGQELIINPSGEKAEAQLGPRLVTILRDQTAYYKYFVNIDSTSLPVGYLLDREYYPVQPTYRSGIAIDLIFKKRIMVKGRLLAPDKRPAAYLAGDIFNSSQQLVDNQFFTNKAGGFLIEGLEPGRYSIVTGKPEWGPLFFEVIPNEKNIADVGDLIVKAGER